MSNFFCELGGRATATPTLFPREAACVVRRIDRRLIGALNEFSQGSGFAQEGPPGESLPGCASKQFIDLDWMYSRMRNTFSPYCQKELAGFQSEYIVCWRVIIIQWLKSQLEDIRFTVSKGANGRGLAGVWLGTVRRCP
ncbi:protein of unknown function [Methylocella tundrae]|uniref:Uncharacterized protein n=1 Tax=Methylocella tundrae TaxID=227605 RepID=A0A4U8YUK9_METTU|nr:protein of unknown function [Methylocella tundrae]